MAKVLAQITLKLQRLMEAGEYRKLRHVGRKEQEIAPGISGEREMMFGTPHSNKLRAARDKEAPRLKELADAYIDTAARMIHCVTTPYEIPEKVSQSFHVQSLAELARGPGELSSDTR